MQILQYPRRLLPPCKFYGSSSGCRYGESCHFSHDRTPFKSVENYNNPSVDMMKEVFKENVDPAELSGTNNNNMTQTLSLLNNSTQQAAIALDGNSPIETQKSMNACPEAVTDGDKGADTTYSPLQSLQDGTNGDQQVEVGSYNIRDMSHAPGAHTIDATPENGISSFSGSVLSVPLVQSHASTFGPATTTATRVTQEMGLREAVVANYTKMEEGPNYALAPVNGRPNGVINEIEIYCGSCKRILERRGNESYCTLLKDHYLECFLDKEGDHVKYVKTKAALEPGQMYWCKSCILIFEKPWSLFQHMADKAKGSKVQRWEKKIHLDWMDSVAGLMAGYDLGLFSPAKLRVDLRNLLADQHTMEEEMEAAAVTAAAMMQWLTPLSSPWRIQQREMMRKIEQLNRQMLRKANMGLAGPGAGYGMRAALTGAQVPTNSSSSTNYINPNRAASGSVQTTQAPPRVQEPVASEIVSEGSMQQSSSKYNVISKPDANGVAQSVSEAGFRDHINADDTVCQSPVGPLGDGNNTAAVAPEEPRPQHEILDSTGAAGDTQGAGVGTVQTKPMCDSVEESEEHDSVTTVVDTNNTNSSRSRGNSTSARGDDGCGRRVEFKRGFNSAPAYGHGGGKAYNSVGPGSKSYNDSYRYQVHSRGSRTPGYGPTSTSFGAGPGPYGTHRANLHRINRMGNGPLVPPSRGANTFNPPSFHASLDFNCGFTDDEVEELLSQGIRPWDSEAAAALAVLRGEWDHLLD
ncbi:unnamed protein product [Dicrocoelium dendriticum]|nr:unnamed protein product [Dicrocoelium dendriticum]